jgi:Domain of unknown function (DUF4349)
MRTFHRSPATLALAALVVVVVAACASSGAALAPVGGTTSSEGGTTGNGAVAAAPSAGGIRDLSGAGGGGQGGDGVGAPVDDAKIVRTGTIDLQVKDVPTALAAARDGIRAMGGYIGASQTQDDDGHPVASVTYRVPADRWEDALDLLGSLGGQTTKVVSQQTNAVEVTSQIVDLDARIRNLQASETALQAIAAKAIKVSDVLAVEAQLTQVRGEIESLTAQRKDLGDRAAYATLTASFGMPVIAVEVAKSEWDPAKVVDDASASLVTVIQSLTTAGIWFAIVWLPVLIVFGVLAAIAVFVARRLGLGRGRGTTSGPAGPSGPATPTGAATEAPAA